MTAPDEVERSEPTISIQAHICPVCHDDHSSGPHRFSDAELLAQIEAAP